MLSTIKQASHLSRPTAQGLGMRVFTIGYFASKLYNVVCMDGKWSSQSARLVSWSHAQRGFIILTADILHSFRATAKWVIPTKWHSQPICNSHSMRHTTFCNLALLPCSCHEVPATNWILFLRYHPLIGHEPWTFLKHGVHLTDSAQQLEIYRSSVCWARWRPGAIHRLSQPPGTLV